MRKPSTPILLLGILITCLSVNCMAASTSTSQPATILSVHQQLRTVTTDTMRDYLIDTAFITTTRLVYIFEVRCGDDVYRSQYIVPQDAKGEPREWNSDVEIRIQGHRMFIHQPDGTELETRIVSHTKS
jgi:hypothetical protein